MSYPGARSPVLPCLLALLTALVLLPSCSVPNTPNPGDGDADADTDGEDSDIPPADGDADADGDGDDDVIDADVPPERGICEECESHEQCGVWAMCIELTGGQRVCSTICEPDVPSCPRGFDCVFNFAAPEHTTCVPVGEACCLDEDADGYGQGVGCRGEDCDDEDPETNPGMDELCNGHDDDCDMEVDGATVDCGDQECLASGDDVYEEIAPGECVAEECTERRATPCGLFTCADGSDSGDICAGSCMRAGEEDDTLCVRRAHCDLGTCELDFDNGDECDEDSDCETDHCDNGFCCDDGVCCGEMMDCPGAPGVTITCDSSTTCQGSRGEAACVDYECTTVDGIGDDSECGTDIEADTCGFFRSIFCTGEEDQPVPRCPAVCSLDADCDDDAHCDATCLPDLPNGDPCDEESDCQSGHCNNHVCCDSGDCCREARDCPASYSTDPTCDSPSTCQGTRDAATCLDYQCGTLADSDDDSACIASIEADTCGLFPSTFCSGAPDQTPPECAVACSSDAECDASAHCDLSSCVPDVPDGDPCDEDSDCQGGHCQNGFCCAWGDCCSIATDCPIATYGAPSTCDDASSCQGRRREPLCNAGHQCAIGDYVDDDSGCLGLTADDCGPYHAVECTAEETQPADQGALCDDSCVGDLSCDPGAHCSTGGECVTDGTVGNPCMFTTECASGLQCVDGVCCTTSCTGLCMACDVAGSLGVCDYVPTGTDPDGECGGVNCSGYFWGWSGDQCFERDDAPASAVDCAGDGSCESADDVCPAEDSGDVYEDCDDTCQEPRSGTCSGTSAGLCDDIDPGTHDCGIGACYREVDQCAGGLPFECVPGSPTSETCNNVDDDCNSTVDDNISSGVSTREPNPTCASYNNLGTVAENSSVQSWTAQIYPSGDEDYYRFYADEASHTCFPWTDQDYRVTVTLDPPSGADCRDFDLRLYNDSCGLLDSSAWGSCTDESIEYDWDGECGSDDSRYFRIEVFGFAGSWECASYTLTVDMEQI